MSAKRTATTELNHNNWNDEDNEPEEKGVFKTATAEELQNRVIKKARRKLPESSDNADGAKRSVFSGFTGFGTSSTVSSTGSPFSFLTKSSSISSTSATAIAADSTKTKETIKVSTEQSTDDKSKTGKSNTYATKLKELNQTVSKWIKSHVDENPVCILTPIFKDYEKYLNEIEKEAKENPETVDTKLSTSSAVSSTSQLSSTSFKMAPVSSTSSISSTFSFTSSATVSPTTEKNPSSIFGSIKPAGKTETEKLATFSGFGSTTTGSNMFGSSGSFSFGSQSANKPETNSSQGFSFSGAKPFSFSSSIIKPPDSSNTNGDEVKEEDEDDQPPKVEFKAVVEEDSIYSKKCKVFVKNEGNFAERGVGTLYLKPVKDSEKTQLLVRADTNLGNILINIILSDGIPAQRMGKNNVMLVCVPTPESEQKPTSTLLRVKTAEDADELLETINKYKK